MKKPNTLPILDQLKIPNEYRVFVDDEPRPPFAVWYIAAERFTGSDDMWQCKSSDYVIELYTIKKDTELEKKLEDIIPASDIEKTEEYFGGENLFCNTYKYTTKNKRRLK